MKRKCRTLCLLLGTLVVAACTADGPTMPSTSPAPDHAVTATEPRHVPISIHCGGGAGATDALLVVNGVVWGRSSEFTEFFREHLNPATIESMEIIRAAPAVARFGSEAADGVIVIETKQGAPILHPVARPGNAGSPGSRAAPHR